MFGTHWSRWPSRKLREVGVCWTHRCDFRLSLYPSMAVCLASLSFSFSICKVGVMSLWRKATFFCFLQQSGTCGWYSQRRWSLGQASGGPGSLTLGLVVFCILMARALSVLLGGKTVRYNSWLPRLAEEVCSWGQETKKAPSGHQGSAAWRSKFCTPAGFPLLRLQIFGNRRQAPD